MQKETRFLAASFHTFVCTQQVEKGTIRARRNSDYILSAVKLYCFRMSLLKKTKGTRMVKPDHRSKNDPDEESARGAQLL